MEENAKKILIVEDDIHVSKVFQIQLEKAGFISLLAFDGEEALKILENEKPNLILLDLMIPKKDGFEVIEEIRKKPEFTNTPVVIISNLGQDSDKARALGLGATEYLVKIDYSIQEIINKVKSHL
jgi:DNA-binding response OmpR family regulator